MNAFTIKKITSPDIHNSQTITFELNSSDIPYAMQDNFVLMEKIPDYLFHYLTVLFYKENLQKIYVLDLSKKSLTTEIDQITIECNHPSFFQLIDNILTTVEKHFPLVIKDLNSFNNPDAFLQQLKKLQLFDKLNEDFFETKKSVQKHKI